MTQTPSRDWRKENEHLNWLITQATEGMQAEKARADTAEELAGQYKEERDSGDEARAEVYGRLLDTEEREQQLKKVVKRAIVILDEIVPHQFDIQTEMETLLSTLYPDTPAPTPDYIDVKFPRAINEAWAFIKGDGSFTGPQLKQWTNDLGPDLSQQILRVLLQTIWADYGGKATQVDTPEIIARPIDDWHEDYGAVLWWEFPVCEPPYCGTPMDADWPDYHTHWTPLLIPAAPAPKEGE